MARERDEAKRLAILAAAKRLFAPDHTVFHWPRDFSVCSAAHGGAGRRASPDYS